MKWKCFQLGHDDRKAKAHILENLAAGGQEHAMSRKLLARFASAAGPIMLIAWESVDLDYKHLYRYATYNRGLRDPGGGKSLTYFDAPVWGLAECVGKWLRASPDTVVVCETSTKTRRALAKYASTSRSLCLGDNEVYYVLSHDDAGKSEFIGDTLHESLCLWATGVCAKHASVPVGDIPSEAFFDAIVASAEHIFTPALEDSGFLVWSPALEGGVTV